MNFYYDFSSMKETNPLDGVTHFYVNPYMMESFKALHLAEKTIGMDLHVTIQPSMQLPVIVLPISILNLGKCKVKINHDLSMIVYTKNAQIYMKPTADSNVVRIDSVLYSNNRI